MTGFLKDFLQPVTVLILAIWGLLSLLGPPGGDPEEADGRWRQQLIGREARELCEAVCEHSVTMEGRITTNPAFALERFEVSPHDLAVTRPVCVCGRRP